MAESLHLLNRLHLLGIHQIVSFDHTFDPYDEWFIFNPGFSSDPLITSIISSRHQLPFGKSSMTTKRYRVLSVLLLPFFSCFGAPRCWAQAISGFTPASAAHEDQIEQQFKSIPNPDEERRQHRIFTAEPHVAGSQRNNELANYIAQEWRKQGLEDVMIRRYDVYSTAPKSTF